MDQAEFNEFLATLKSKRGPLQMSHIYKPAMLLAVIRSGGRATRRQIAEAFVLRDEQQIEYYHRKIVHPMPGQRLVRDGLLAKEGDGYSLNGTLANLSDEQLRQVEEILERRIEDYLQLRNPFGDSNLDAIRGSVRFEVLRRSGGRCELCGVSSRITQIDVDHIVPRAHGGSNDLTNLQALCRTCNAQKRDRDDTDFRRVNESYSDRVSGCVFCEANNRVVEENELGFVIADGFPVTPGHKLIIPKRHVSDYFELHDAEQKALHRLLVSQRRSVLQEDRSVAGFNVGVNIAEAAGQTIFHAHVHLIPRRFADVGIPTGGVRNVIPGAGEY